MPHKSARMRMCAKRLCEESISAEIFLSITLCLTTEERVETEDQTAPGKSSEGGADPGQQDCDGGQ